MTDLAGQEGEGVTLSKYVAPHGPDDPCTCPGCHDGRTGCYGYTVGCCCDIDWDAMSEGGR